MQRIKSAADFWPRFLIMQRPEDAFIGEDFLFPKGLGLPPERDAGIVTRVTHHDEHPGLMVHGARRVAGRGQYQVQIVVRHGLRGAERRRRTAAASAHPWSAPRRRRAARAHPHARHVGLVLTHFFGA